MAPIFAVEKGFGNKKRIFPGHSTITISQMRLFRFMSNLALDAPLVGASWWVLLDHWYPSPGSHWFIPAALASTVWFVYLLDRILDAGQTETLPAPLRKVFARNHPILMRGLLVLSLVLSLRFGLSLSPALLFQAALIAVATGVYFAGRRQIARHLPFPAKELLIGICFATSTGLPFGSWTQWQEIGAIGILASLCTLNCLSISRAEVEFDRISDPSAWFARSERPFPFRTVLFSTSSTTAILIWGGLHPIPGLALIGAAAALAAVARSRPNWSTCGQPLADAALWAPALAGAWIR